MLSLSPAPPLTVENIVKEVEGVMRTTALWQCLNGYNVMCITIPPPSIKRAVKEFLRERRHYQPSWRAVIFALDGAEETHIANRIRHYAEPVQGRYILCD